MKMCGEDGRNVWEGAKVTTMWFMDIYLLSAYYIEARQMFLSRIAVAI